MAGAGHYFNVELILPLYRAVVDGLCIVHDAFFSPTQMDRQTDLRFVFCAAAICVMLDDWDGIDQLKAVDFIFKSQSYEGGFALAPGSESHGGATYCGLSALWLITQFAPSWPSTISLSSLINLGHTMRWCLQRQVKSGGFQGRSNKPADSCHAFWYPSSYRDASEECPSSSLPSTSTQF